MSDLIAEKIAYNTGGADQSLRSDDESEWTQEQETRARRKYVRPVRPDFLILTYGTIGSILLYCHCCFLDC